MTGTTSNRNRWGWGLAFGGTSVLLVLATLPPFVGSDLRGIVMIAFSGACHQIADRSPHILDIQLAVCHRCYGIYLALPVAALAFPFVHRWDEWLNRRAPFLLSAAVAVPGLDWLGGVIGLWTNTSISRLLTGAIFGVIAGYFLSRSLSGAFERRRKADRLSARGSK